MVGIEFHYLLIYCSLEECLRPTTGVAVFVSIKPCLSYSGWYVLFCASVIASEFPGNTFRWSLREEESRCHCYQEPKGKLLELYFKKNRLVSSFVFLIYFSSSKKYSMLLDLHYYCSQSPSEQNSVALAALQSFRNCLCFLVFPTALRVSILEIHCL